MRSIKKTTKEVVTQGRDAAVRVGKVAKSAAVAGAKAGAAAAIAAGTLEAQKSWKETSPEAKKRTKNGMMAMAAGVAVIAAGVAIAKSRKNK